MTKFKIIILVLLIAISCKKSSQIEFKNYNDYFKKFDNYNGFTFQDSKKIRDTFKYKSSTYLNSGDNHSRYVFTHMPEFFFHTSPNKLM